MPLRRHAHRCDGRGVWRKRDDSGAGRRGLRVDRDNRRNLDRITSGAAGQGDGGVAVAVEANTGGACTARVVVAQTDVVIEQVSISAPAPPATPPPPSSPPPPPPPPGCTYTIQPGGQTVAADGGPATIDVTASGEDASWAARSNAAWIAVTEGASGTGNGRVTFNVGANAGSSRTGTLSVAGHTFTLTQAARPAVTR